MERNNNSECSVNHKLDFFYSILPYISEILQTISTIYAMYKGYDNIETNSSNLNIIASNYTNSKRIN